MARLEVFSTTSDWYCSKLYWALSIENTVSLFELKVTYFWWDKSLWYAPMDSVASLLLLVYFLPDCWCVDHVVVSITVQEGGSTEFYPSRRNLPLCLDLHLTIKWNEVKLILKVRKAKQANGIVSISHGNLSLTELYREHTTMKCASFSTEQKWHNLVSLELGIVVHYPIPMTSLIVWSVARSLKICIRANLFYVEALC